MRFLGDFYWQLKAEWYETLLGLPALESTEQKIAVHRMLCSGLRHNYRLVSSTLCYLTENAITGAVMLAAQILARGAAECMFASCPKSSAETASMSRSNVVQHNRLQSPTASARMINELLHCSIQPARPEIKDPVVVGRLHAQMKWLRFLTAFALII